MEIKNRIDEARKEKGAGSKAPWIPDNEDCPQCKYIGGTGLSLMGLVVIREAHRKRDTGTSIKSKILTQRQKFVTLYLFAFTLFGLAGLRFTGSDLNSIGKTILSLIDDE